MTAHELLRVGTDRLRVSSWRGNQGIAVVVPAPDAPPPSVHGLDRCVDLLAARGITKVLTGALSDGEQQPFLDAGFSVHEHLHLLAHDLRWLPERDPRAGLRRAGTRDRPRALAVDHLAFAPFWRLDEAGLDDALAATPSHRFRVAPLPGGRRSDVAGYAVCGRAGPRGYVQRLAVTPRMQGRGLGRALMADGLWWLRRHGVEQAVVNTQTENHTALRLYRSLGFVDQPRGLAVLARTVGPPTT